jgi:hypothetical protein
MLRAVRLTICDSSRLAEAADPGAASTGSPIHPRRKINREYPVSHPALIQQVQGPAPWIATSGSERIIPHSGAAANDPVFEFTCHRDQINVPMVKLSLALLSSFAVIGGLSSSAEDVLPPRFNFDRYTPMLNRSPFAVATAVALPEATPNFAKDLYIANAARSPEGDLVTVRSSSDQIFKKYLTTREPVDGYSIASIEWSEDVGKTKVTIGKDGQFATLTFNQSLLSQAASAGRPIANQMPPRVPIIPSPGTGQASRARARSVIERNPKTASAPTSNAATESRLETAPAPAVPVPPPDIGLPKEIVLPKPLGGSQELFAPAPEPSG